MARSTIHYSLPHVPILLLVSDQSRLGERSLEDVFFPALSGGVNMVLLRESALAAGEVMAAAERLRKLCVGGVPLLVHDRLDVALAARADGAHLDVNGLPVRAARKLAPKLLVGRTVSSVAEAVAAERAGATYLLVEPVFSTYYAHGHTPFGPTLIRGIANRVHIPVLAGGGITAGNAHQVISAGAAGVSVISEIVASNNPEQAARDLLTAMRSAWESRPLKRESLV